MRAPRALKSRLLHGGTHPSFTVHPFLATVHVICYLCVEYHVESLNRSVQLHVSGFLPSYCYEQAIKGSKGSCVGCRWHKTSFWAKYILTVDSYEFSKIFLLSRRQKSLNRSKIACTQAAGEMHVCASLIWSADVGTNRAVHTDQFDLFSDFFGRFSDSTWYIFCTVYVKLNFYSILCEKQMIFFPTNVSH